MGPLTVKEPAKALEEQLELSNITDLRRDLLKIVDEIQKNPAIRLLILKHGRPQAVLMSAEAYDVMKKAAKLLLDQSKGLSREQNISDAISRFEAERSAVPVEDVAPAIVGSNLVAGKAPTIKLASIKAGKEIYR